jgi:cobaltochelatase CobN
VGLLYPRSNWLHGNLEVERAVVAALEKRGVGVIPVFHHSIKDDALGNLSGAEVVERFLMAPESPKVSGVIKLGAFPLGSRKGASDESVGSVGAALFARLGIPLFGPTISYYQSPEQWAANPQGLGSQVGWSLAMPEFEGVIEPMVLGASGGAEKPEEEAYLALPDRVERFAARVAKWMVLASKPNRDKRVAFILHNNPCVSVEASVGGAAHLDSLESVARILAGMKEAGYQVDPPRDGKALIDDIMARKAISEFRWTTTAEIVQKGGALEQLPVERYLPWFEELPERTRARMTETWGAPPGEELDGVPAAMVHDGRILITGVRYGNAVVCAQPKRGCAGPRCDGQVCKILHDPDLPPPHQYVATYKWLSREFAADVLVHVGTHGNLEFLPGKATGLSASCFPDIGIDTLPHLYIYNADNPPEGTIAKRRSNAVLVDHMQTVMVRGELYGDMEALERLLDDYQRCRSAEPAKAHTIAHLIAEKAKGLKLVEGEVGHGEADALVPLLHEKLSLLKNTYVPKGMHVFGQLPEGDRLAAFVHGVARYEGGPASLRGIATRCARAAADAAPDSDEGEALAFAACQSFLAHGTPLSEILERVASLAPGEQAALPELEAKLQDITQRVQASDELGALLRGMDGGYIAPGPSGLITRGRPDVLPSGRNFYSLDPQRIPSPAAWAIGQQLAEKTLEHHLEAEGRYPETIAFYWQSTDIMWTDGEGLAQMLALMGVRPVWQSNGRVKEVEVLPIEELGRPRIDLAVRVSGITRDNFPGAIDLLDEAVRRVAALDESDALNFVRKHTLARLAEAGGGDSPEALRRASFRIFASRPGTYSAGTQLAVYASAWKTEKDLSDVFLFWNGYAYGKGVFGEVAHRELEGSLKTVEATFNKTPTDEYDLSGCCCYFGAHGGMINAARVLSGREVKNYYGDTREQGAVTVRTLEEEIRRVARAKILNPIWIAGMKDHGYKGAAEISKRVGRLYGWQATAKAVDGEIFDDVARTFVMDEENRRFLQENNPWAMEEMSRRLLEAAQRGIWQPAEDVKEKLSEIYLEVEGWIEERTDGVGGEYQGGSVDILTADDVPRWKAKMKEVL